MWLRLPAMVVSLGIAMVYEAVAYGLNDSKGIRLIGRDDLLIFAKWPNDVILLGCVLVVLVYLLNFTKFGYNTNSLRTGQKNAVDVGVNEKRNTVACYVIAGALLAMAGAVYFSRFGIMHPRSAWAACRFFMDAFLPMFIGMARWPSTPTRTSAPWWARSSRPASTRAFITLGFSISVQQRAQRRSRAGVPGLALQHYKIGLHQLHKAKKEAALKDKARGD